ncbi:MAG: Hsp20/alpha crystallin family protein [Pseudomonadota bacterium]
MLARDGFPSKMASYRDRFEPFAGFDFLPRLAWPRKPELSAEWRPSADIVETKDEFLVKCELPEVKKEAVKIDIVDGMLRIRGERKLSFDVTKDTVHRLETFYGRFERLFTVPDNVDPKTIRAEVLDGMLNVHLPTVAAIQPKPIEVPIQ